jgi:hypothetical protein
MADIEAASYPAQIPPAGTLAQRISAINSKTAPQTRLDWALWWAKRGMSVFPAEHFLGTPLEPKWYSTASSERKDVVAWWAAMPTADIAAVPERSGHFVIVAHGPRGRMSLFELEDEYGALGADFFYATRWGDLHVWLKGDAHSSRGGLRPGLDVVGAGRFLFLPPSSAPDPLFSE